MALSAHKASRRRLLQALPVALTGLALAACTSQTGVTASSPPTSLETASPQGTSTSNPQPAPEATVSQAGTTPIHISLGNAFDDTVIEATLDDSAAARSLLAQLPLDVSFSDYGGQELTASLPQDLDTTGMTAAAPQPGDIGWYEPGKVLVLYYTAVGSWPGLYVIGHTDYDVVLLARQADLPASITRAQ
ncbi:cyclophilin-like fold protein [Actinomyces sp.]|uniref:cyclophilin-like fold protein n=1 Tax=Actinomyces sp. TaxID=29317 RepID=UPI0026DBAB49|nr:cyclophilin-like fold protein [Actinomyces sp.]MDO4900548.1 cyclophilin-like fold protein [Actinomyces sp.]